MLHRADGHKSLNRRQTVLRLEAAGNMVRRASGAKVSSPGVPASAEAVATKEGPVSKRWLSARIVLVILSATQAGCASREPSEADFAAARILDNARSSVRTPAGDTESGWIKLSAGATRPVAEIPQAPSWHAERAKGSSIVLTYSGGGSYGAFGVGVTTSLMGKVDWKDVRIVCGVSAGSLIAMEAFAATSAKDMEYFTKFYVEDPRSRFLGDTRSANVQTKTVTPILRDRVRVLLPALASAHRSGKRWFIGTTDMTRGEYVIWNAGLIASQAESSTDPDLKTSLTAYLADIVRASCSAPTLLYPVPLPEVVGSEGGDKQVVFSQHADGGIGFNFVPASQLLGALAEGPTTVIAVRDGYRSLPRYEKRMDDDLLWMLNFVGRSAEIWIGTTEQAGLHSFVGELNADRVAVYECFIPTSCDVRAKMSSLEWREGRTELLKWGIRVGEDLGGHVGGQHAK